MKKSPDKRLKLKQEKCNEEMKIKLPGLYLTMQVEPLHQPQVPLMYKSTDLRLNFTQQEDTPHQKPLKKKRREKSPVLRLNLTNQKEPPHQPQKPLKIKSPESRLKLKQTEPPEKPQKPLMK